MLRSVSCKRPRASDDAKSSAGAGSSASAWLRVCSFARGRVIGVDVFRVTGRPSRFTLKKNRPNGKWRRRHHETHARGGSTLLSIVPALSYALPCLTCDNGGDPEPKPTPPPACPNPVPPLPSGRPATADEIRCKALHRCEAVDLDCQRCGVPITSDECSWVNDFAFSSNLMNSAALAWLRANKFCVVPRLPRYDAIVDICPGG